MSLFGLKNSLNSFLQIFSGLLKVEEWLKQQPDPTTGTDPSMGHEADNTYVLNLLETIKVVLDGTADSLFTKFSISQLSGSIGIASTQAKPTLSVMYPDTNRPPLVLSRDNRYTSTVFVAIADKEYLVSSSRDDICLWNLADNTSKVVYKFEESGRRRLCVIDEKTITCVDEQPSSDGFGSVYILNTDSEKFSLSSKIMLKANGIISDIYHVKTMDDTSCLLLNFPLNHHVQLVGMVGGRVRWQVDQQKMSESFRPLSICTDGSTVFVVNTGPAVLHLLSVEDGSFLRSIGLRLFGFHLPSCVRIQKEHLYVGHENREGTYCISKLTKPV